MQKGFPLEVEAQESATMGKLAAHTIEFACTEAVLIGEPW
jgi:hypothetical protein